MSKTPRTDAALDMRQECIKLETELGDMRAQFTEYVKAEDAWRDERNQRSVDDYRIEAAKLRKQAKQTLGL